MQHVSLPGAGKVEGEVVEQVAVDRRLAQRVRLGPPQELTGKREKC